MKRLILFLLVFGVGGATVAIVATRQQSARYARELETQRALWEAEKADLEAALERARARRADPSPLVMPTATPAAIAQVNPQELLAKLAALPAVQGRSMRQVVALLEQLAQAGTPALPAIAEFLASGKDITYESLTNRWPRDVKGLADAITPASLRFGLFDVVRQIGGEDAEKILADTMAATGRGIEIAYLTHLLEELAPGKYRETALTAARNLLARGGGSERFDRDYLYAVLLRYSDASYVVTAQAGLVQPDGKVDRSSLRYLQQTLGEQAVGLVAQAYRDSRVTEADAKEPLARVALAYVGVNPQAAELFHTAALDPVLTPSHRRNLIEDLNEEGLVNRRTPTPEDLKIIANRYTLTQTYLQQDYVQNDRLLTEAFREADKDLRNLLQQAAARNTTGPR